MPVTNDISRRQDHGLYLKALAEITCQFQVEDDNSKRAILQSILEFTNILLMQYTTILDDTQSLTVPGLESKPPLTCPLVSNVLPAQRITADSQFPQLSLPVAPDILPDLCIEPTSDSQLQSTGTPTPSNIQQGANNVVSTPVYGDTDIPRIPTVDASEALTPTPAKEGTHRKRKSIELLPLTNKLDPQRPQQVKA
ncbi:hypothetical protein GMDG_06685 [Pseudogymnoascus destructans 20631-21]|uniref:Uncharacterized protein n=1 Tax=Pseudogymnoascus destructans (strain ATCC MYA-4855 / 20631-21) TaxID=658429 RepID=L8FUR8_PSED2|nr:hypothetical protein GMDG_06685 [Pseudogymnoascus destructans 20631-21]